MEYNLYSLIDRTFQLNGDPVPFTVRAQLLKDKGSDIDTKCCHCAVFYGKRKSLDEEVSRI